MERKRPELDKNKSDTVKARAEQKGGLCNALWEYASNGYSNYAVQAAWKELTKMYGKAPDMLSDAEEFWNPVLQQAVAYLTDDAYMRKLMCVTRLRLKGQFSDSMWRRSYHTANFAYHAVRAVQDLSMGIYLYTYKQDAKELLYCDHAWLRGYELILAAELADGNGEITELVKEAMQGENGEVLLSAKIFRAVVISGREDLIELMIKLLLAARLQEGLRQQILENADAGSVGTLTKFLKVCIEEDMFRYSSVIRALDTWTGLGFSDVKPAVVQKYARLAYDCLTNETVRQQYENSTNNLEAYFALWGQGCHEVERTDAIAEKLLNGEEKYRRILGWYFVSHTDSTRYRMQMAERHLKERDKEILAWVVHNLAVTREVLSAYTYGKKEWSIRAVPNTVFPSDAKERRELFDSLREVAELIGNKQQTFTGNPFPFSEITLENEPVINCMISIAGYDLNADMTDTVLELLPLMSVDQRRAVYINLLEPETNAKHRAHYRKALEDRSIHVKELAVQRLADCVLSAEDLQALSESLSSKSSPLRKSILSILQKQKSESLFPLLHEMLSSKEEYSIQGAIELLLYLKENNSELQSEMDTELAALRERKLSTQTTILLEQLIGGGQQEAQNYSLENGFGVYDPQVVEEYVKNLQQQKAAAEKKEKKGLFGLFAAKEENGLFTEKDLKKKIPDGQIVMTVLERMNRVFERHADYEYETQNWDGSCSKVLFGDAQSSLRVPAEFGRVNSSTEMTLDMVPFYEEFLEAFGEYAADIEKMLGLCYVTFRYTGDSRGFDMESQPWYEQLLQKNLSPTYHNAAHERYGTRYWQMMDIIRTLPHYFDAHAVFLTAMKWYRSLIAIVGEEQLGRNCVQKKQNSNVTYYGGSSGLALINCRMFGYWRIIIKQTAVAEEDFAEWFMEEYRLEHLAKVTVLYPLVMQEYFRAYEAGLIPKDILTEILLVAPGAGGNIRFLTNSNKFRVGKNILQQYPWAPAYVQSLIDRVAEVEARRGELPTPLTPVAREIERLEGAEHFCALLAALGKEKFFRGYEYSSDTTKRAVLSRLLKRCYPKKEDTPDALQALLKQTDVTDKRLVEAVMYAPQWAAFAEEILGWQGLKCGVWFFHAHINESFSAEKETEVALYSPITPAQFNDGTFDKDWFMEAYGALGEKRFALLYQSAKYITAGSNQHRRSQLYADAVLGKLNQKELEAEIIEKRNQEKLRCFPLLPLGEAYAEESLHRYEFIQRFLKESRQFGAQRKESEKKACSVALENLALTMGLGDVNRMTWYLESEKLEQIRPLMEEKELDGVAVRLQIEDDGNAELAVSKNGKSLKTLPKAIQKNEYILTLKETVKELKEQKRRAKESLERAMTECTEFGLEEIERIAGNPVLAPMLCALVWNNGTDNGFLKQSAEELLLCAPDGREVPLSTDKTGTVLRIAHPHDFIQSGQWSSFMHFVYERKLLQPFKQIFREYYPMTEDEKAEKTISRRYAGHQVQPQKTVALLKGRGWSVDYEEGLQKVYYKENLIVRMYALADWFSPADIEAPTLETIHFYDRKSGKAVEFEKVPPILFSEAMRDMDLAVSVAHAGGVDPEASHSSVEMRTAIAKELLGLFKLGNVEFIGSHAKIHGTLADYSVHMGSGVVHAEAVGMLAILPVHSQARGRIFLPFADDDPKTAEILSKIILLAEDGKIKDTEILRQIRG